MFDKFRSYLDEVRRVPEDICPEPELDKVQKDQIRQFREAEALTSGAIQEAVLEPGTGQATPKEGDLVYVHFSVAVSDDECRYSTRQDAGGHGSPLAFMLGKAPRVPRGWEVSLLEMKAGERRALKIRPEFAFCHTDCNFHLPDRLRELEKQELLFDLQLVHWYPCKEVDKVLGTDQVLKRTLQQGEGWENPRPPYEVIFDCTTRVSRSDGFQCQGDSYYQTDPGKPLQVCMGASAVPQGVELALGGMVKQEKSVFLVPRELMHPHAGASTFPEPPADVEQVEIEIHLKSVVQVRDMLGDGRVLKRRIREGEGEFPIDCPVEDCQVKVNYKARTACSTKASTDDGEQDWVFDSRSQDGQPVEAELGCGILPEGVEAAARLMLPNELARVHCHPEAAYKTEPESAPAGIAPDQPVEFEVELVGFERAVELRDQTAAECIRGGQAGKEIANKLYKQGKYKLASVKYEKTVRSLGAIRGFETEEDVKEADNLKVVCMGNLALCCLAEDDFAGAVEWCTKALKIDEENTKMLLRRAKALSLRGDFEDAESDYLLAKDLDSSLADEVEAALLKNKQRRKAAVQKQKKEFGSFFPK